MAERQRLAIRVEHLSKRYQIGKVGTGSLLRDVEGWFSGGVRRLRRRGAGPARQTDDAYHKMALDDLSFELPQGEILGIIGRNGAGKSTLLKLITKITSPTSGRICINGRISSLLEVGTGFHPELTGRENIFMNGAVLGMGGAEIRKKMDAIIDFSGVSAYIDTPVKHYSSGMYTRLAFSVAAHLEPDILILDEVMAVGDAEFSRKSLARMKEVNLKEGRTVILVSHSLDNIVSVAKNCLHLEQGRMKDFGPAEQVVMRYKDALNVNEDSYANFRSAGSPWIELRRILTMNLDGQGKQKPLRAGAAFRLRLVFDVSYAFAGDVSIFIQTTSYHPVMAIRHSDSGRPLDFTVGRNIVDLVVDRPFLLHGKYLITLMVTDPERKGVYEQLQHMPGISVVGTRAGSGYPSELDPRSGPVFLPLGWEHRLLTDAEDWDKPDTDIYSDTD
jgi:ABC-type polysaccharide/polyol phosphate transport system ATPase subunit